MARLAAGSPKSQLQILVRQDAIWEQPNSLFSTLCFIQRLLNTFLLGSEHSFPSMRSSRWGRPRRGAVGNRNEISEAAPLSCRGRERHQPLQLHDCPVICHIHYKTGCSLLKPSVYLFIHSFEHQNFRLPTVRSCQAMFENYRDKE